MIRQIRFIFTYIQFLRLNLTEYLGIAFFKYSLLWNLKKLIRKEMWIVIKQIDSALKWYYVRLLGHKKQNNNANASISWSQNMTPTMAL